MKTEKLSDTITIIHADCRDVLPVECDSFVTDPPYGMTDYEWDIEPDWNSFFPLLRRCAETIVMTMQKPKTWTIATLFPPRHHWTWYKSKSSSPSLARSGPLRVTEDVLVFGGDVWNPQPLIAHPANVRKNRMNTHFKTKERYARDDVDDILRKPIDLLDFPSNTGECHAQHIQHSTQKPVELFEYLLRTYTNKSQIVCDPFMGSGTTGLACIRTGRGFIGMEKNEHYYRIARKRLMNELAQTNLFRQDEDARAGQGECPGTACNSASMQVALDI